jgi:hypothetical protein
MGTHPWMAERMVASRCEDRDRAVRNHRQPSGTVPSTAVASPAPHARRRVSRRLGTLLIAAGRRLAGPEALRTALDRAGFEAGHSAA